MATKTAPSPARARRARSGKIQQANGGTLFLDEIGDMPKHLQARLLRVLQERKVNPLGSTKEVDVDVAVISATHKNLKEMIARGDFREDLYYRLNGLVVRLPALRDRTDFQLVVNKILKALCENSSKVTISPPVMDVLRRFHWPGNFRQLHNLLRTAVVMVGCEGQIEMSHLPDDFLEELEVGQTPHVPHRSAGGHRIGQAHGSARRQSFVARTRWSPAARCGIECHGQHAAPAQRQCVGGGQGAGRFAQHHLPQKRPAAARRAELRAGQHAQRASVHPDRLQFAPGALHVEHVPLLVARPTGKCWQGHQAGFLRLVAFVHGSQHARAQAPPGRPG